MSININNGEIIMEYHNSKEGLRVFQRTILLVDDELKMRIQLKNFLEGEGFTVIEAPDGRFALEMFESKQASIDLVLLDINLPYYDGWTVCRQIRKVSDVPIVMLATEGSDSEEISSFEAGADDFIVRPIRPKVLLARTNALLRRVIKENTPAGLYFDGLMIDKNSHRVTLDGEEITLSPKEYAVLMMLVESSGRVISREQLLNHIWGYDYFGGLRTVDTHINRLRLKLQDRCNLISTIRGFGYRFEGCSCAQEIIF
jgi:DNA-binding response OmpR family regulator